MGALVVLSADVDGSRVGDVSTLNILSKALVFHHWIKGLLPLYSTTAASVPSTSLLSRELASPLDLVKLDPEEITSSFLSKNSRSQTKCLTPCGLTTCLCCGPTFHLSGSLPSDVLPFLIVVHPTAYLSCVFLTLCT